MPLIPGGHLTRSKAMFPSGWNGGHGAYVRGADGRYYLDMLCALGARSLTNSDSQPRASQGVYSLSQSSEQEAAEAVLKCVAPWASSVRFVKTGSESTHAAYMIAKRATGRSRVVMHSLAYHGWHEWCQEGTICKYEYGDHGSTSFAEWNLDDIAAVFVEPLRFQSNDVDWLRHVRAYCDRAGALLVFDSMIFGGRFALGGTSEYFGIFPDMECYGKALGGGQSVAFVVGNEALAQHGEMISGTYSGDTVGLDAVIETLQVYTSQPVIDTMWARGRQLQEGLRRIVPADVGVCEGAPVHQRIRFFNEAHGKPFSAAMWARGILWHPGCTNIMYAHTEEQIEQVLAAAGESVRCL